MRGTNPDPAEQVPLVARSVTPPSPSGRGGTTLLRQRAPRSCTVFVMTPPNEHTSEGGRDDRGVPYHAESALSSAQVLKQKRKRSQKHRQWPSAGVSGGGRDLTLRADDPTSRGTTQPPTNPTQHQTTPLKARFSCWALSFNEGADVVVISSLWSVHGREEDVRVVREEAKYTFF